MIKQKKVIKPWKQISPGDTFLDGSHVISIHDSYISDSYRLIYGIKNNTIVLSDSHLLLCDVKHLNKESKMWVEKNFGQYAIPTLYDQHRWEEYPDKCEWEVVESDPSKVNDHTYWLTISALALLVKQNHQKIYCNGHRIKKVDYVGQLEVFCVETDSHRFNTRGLIHHNSVTLRNIIFHCLTHENISVALIDLKFTEFEKFKGMKNVVTVANTVQETVELLRIARECMYKRNQELAKLGLNDIKDFKPVKPTDEVIVAGRRLKDTDEVEIKKNGQVKKVTVKELEQYL